MRDVGSFCASLYSSFYHPGGNDSTDSSHSNSTKLLNQSRKVFLKYLHSCMSIGY